MQAQATCRPGSQTFDSSSDDEHPRASAAMTNAIRTPQCYPRYFRLAMRASASFFSLPQTRSQRSKIIGSVIE